MDINSFFIKLIKELNLGNIIDGPFQVNGGLTHRMFRVNTSKGKYIVKLLNSNIMKRNTAMDNFNKAENYEEVLKKNNIKAIYSLKFNNIVKSLQITTSIGLTELSSDLDVKNEYLCYNT